MNNGLQGRYLDQLNAWNNARNFAAELVSAFKNSDESIQDVIRRWKNPDVSLPSLSQIKNVLSDVVFITGRSCIDRVARAAMKWDDWYEMEVPSVETENDQRISVTA